jgi:hypothetical protein
LKGRYNAAFDTWPNFPYILTVWSEE